MNKFAIGLLAGIFAGTFIPGVSRAQVNAADSVAQHVKGNRFSVGGYGEVNLYTRIFQ